MFYHYFAYKKHDYRSNCNWWNHRSMVRVKWNSCSSMSFHFIPVFYCIIPFQWFQMPAAAVGLLLLAWSAAVVAAAVVVAAAAYLCHFRNLQQPIWDQFVRYVNCLVWPSSWYTSQIIDPTWVVASFWNDINKQQKQQQQQQQTNSSSSIWNHWNGMVQWNTGMEWKDMPLQ